MKSRPGCIKSLQPFLLAFEILILLFISPCVAFRTVHILYQWNFYQTMVDRLVPEGAELLDSKSHYGNYYGNSDKCQYVVEMEIASNDTRDKLESALKNLMLKLPKEFDDSELLSVRQVWSSGQPRPKFFVSVMCTRDAGLDPLCQ